MSDSSLHGPVFVDLVKKLVCISVQALRTDDAPGSV